MSAISTATVDLERRLAHALGTHSATPTERSTVQKAYATAASWDALPADVRRLVEDIESRPARS